MIKDEFKLADLENDERKNEEYDRKMERVYQNGSKPHSEGDFEYTCAHHKELFEEALR